MRGGSLFLSSNKRDTSKQPLLNHQVKGKSSAYQRLHKLCLLPAWDCEDRCCQAPGSPQFLAGGRHLFFWIMDYTDLVKAYELPMGQLLLWWCKQ